MAIISQDPSRENPTDRFPLLMEKADNDESNEHVIDVERVDEASSSSSDSSDNCFPHCLNIPNHETEPSRSGQVPLTQSPSSAPSASNFRSSSLPWRSEGFDRRWSPFNTALWISLELIFTVGQIIAAVVVLCLSRNENPQTPLFAWVVGYATGCALSLPFYYWRYILSNQIIDERSNRPRQGSRRGNSTSEPNSYITISLTRSSEEEADQNTSTSIWNGQSFHDPNARFGLLLDHFKMALDCFYAVWFVVGNIWIFGGHSSSSDAPNLYRLCLVFLTFSCIGYAMPFILCGMICCCLPCIIHFLGVREGMNGVKGATEESINALPKHKFKLKRTPCGSSGDDGSGIQEGGFLAAGTELGRAVSGEDAVCCICLTKYEDDDELRELPCSHFFHTGCVDKWLKINSSCPLCKYEIGNAEDATLREPSQRH